MPVIGHASYIIRFVRIHGQRENYKTTVQRFFEKKKKNMYIILKP